VANPTAVSPEKESSRSLLFTLLEEAKVTDEAGRFRIAIPGGKEVRYLTFRNYQSVEEAESLKVQAKNMVSMFKGAGAIDPSFSEFKDENPNTVYSAFLLGLLCDDLSFPEFLRLAREAPMLFVTIRDGVDAACIGVDSHIFKEELDAAKKD